MTEGMAVLEWKSSFSGVVLDHSLLGWISLRLICLFDRRNLSIVSLRVGKKGMYVHAR